MRPRTRRSGAWSATARPPNIRSSCLRSPRPCCSSPVRISAPASGLVFALLTFAHFSAFIAVVGLPDDVIGQPCGRMGRRGAVPPGGRAPPAATPSLSRSSRRSRRRRRGFRPPVQESDVWGETRFSPTRPTAPRVTVEVIGRDATDRATLRQGLAVDLVQGLRRGDLPEPDPPTRHRVSLADRRTSRVPVSDVVISRHRRPAGYRSARPQRACPAHR